jgi:hypothetical protein
VKVEPASARAACLAIVVLGCALSSGPRAAARSQSASVPVVVELFTSEGCSSCPPADALLQRIVDAQPLAGVEIIGLGEHVDYWDHQGWKDRFSSSSFTERQQGYGAHFRSDSIYTPQMVVDGRAEFVGSDGDAARRAIQRASTLAHGRVEVSVAATAIRETDGLHVSVTSSGLPSISSGDRADLVVAITEDHLESKVTRGENHGRTLQHAAVVRPLQVAGEPAAGGGPLTTDVRLDPSWQRDRLKIVAFVQERRSRAILASAAARLSLLAQP